MLLPQWRDVFIDDVIISTSTRRDTRKRRPLFQMAIVAGAGFAQISPGGHTFLTLMVSYKRLKARDASAYENVSFLNFKHYIIFFCKTNYCFIMLS